MSIAARRKKIGKYLFVVIILAAIIITQSLSTSGISTTPPAGNYVNVMDMGATGDGTTNDSTAIALALNEAQTYGLDLYFPAGTYNFNGGNLTANDNLRIFGDGGSTILYNPGSISCYSDIAVEDLSVYKETGVFIYMKPTGYSDVYVNNVTVYNDLNSALDCRAVYCLIQDSEANRGIDNVTFTNNNISNCQTGLMLLCAVKSGGLVANNTLTNLGDPVTPSKVYGIGLGTTDATTNDEINANNVTVINNTISDVHAAYAQDGSISQSYGILVIGANVKILDNHLENLEVWTGIYSKATDLVIRGNTLINAANRSSIVVKSWYAEDKDILIEKNIISSVLTENTLDSEDKAIGIRIEAPRVTIRNNEMSLYTQYAASVESSAVVFSTILIQNVILEGNTIYTERSCAFLFDKGIDVNGHIAINGNTITQNMTSDSVSLGRLFYIKKASASTVVDCNNNTLNVDRGIFVSYVTTLGQGGVLNLSGNTITGKALGGWAYMFSMAGMVCNMTNNTITLNENSEFYSPTDTTYGLLQGGASSVPYRVENNIIYCNAPNTAYLFSMPTSFTMTGNQIRVAPGSKLLGVVTYSPAANAAAGEVTTITDNTIDRITGALSGNAVATADYFVRFYTSDGNGNVYTLPEINISDNTVVVKQRLINRPTSGGGVIPSIGTVSVTGNLIHSELGSNVSAVIDTAVWEANLVLDNNWRAAGVEDITNS